MASACGASFSTYQHFNKHPLDTTGLQPVVLQFLPLQELLFSMPVCGQVKATEVEN
jgi:hypothetical protein